MHYNPYSLYSFWYANCPKCGYLGAPSGWPLYPFTLTLEHILPLDTTVFQAHLVFSLHPPMQSTIFGVAILLQNKIEKPGLGQQECSLLWRGHCSQARSVAKARQYINNNKRHTFVLIFLLKYLL